MNPNQPQPPEIPNDGSLPAPEEPYAQAYTPPEAAQPQQPAQNPDLYPPYPVASNQPEQYNPETVNNSYNQPQPPTQPGQLPAVNPSYQQNPYQARTPGNLNPYQGTPRPIDSNTGMDSFKSTKASRPSSRKIMLLVGGLIILIIISIAIWSIFIAKNNQEQSANSNESSSSTTEINDEPQAIEAQSMDYMSMACNNVGLSNASIYDSTSSKPIVLFTEANETQFLRSDISVDDKDRTVPDDEYQQIQLVGCLSRKETTNTGVKCEVTDETEKTRTLSLYNVKYQLTIREALTAKVISNNDIDSAATKCPLEMKIIQNDPKIYVTPNAEKVNKVIRAEGSSN